MTRLSEIERRLAAIEAELRAGDLAAGTLAKAPEPKEVFFDMPNIDCQQRRFVSTDLADGVLVFSWLALFRTDEDLNLRAATLRINVSIQKMFADGGFDAPATVVDDSLTGCWTKEYQRRYDIGPQTGHGWGVTVDQTIEPCKAAA